MLTHPTLDQLRALRLDGMADAFVELQSQDRAKDLAPAEWLALMLDREATHRGTQRFKSLRIFAMFSRAVLTFFDVLGG